MRMWHGVVTKLAKKGKGAVVKNRKGSEEVLIPFTKGAFIEIDLDSNTYHSDSENTPWATEPEQAYVKIGTEVQLLSNSDTFPTRADQVESANFRDAIDVIKGGEMYSLAKGGVIIIHHDFKKEMSRGDSGGAFAEAVEAWYKTELFKPVFKVDAGQTYAKTITQLEQISLLCVDNVFVDTILIATHGSAGQLWLGAAESDELSNVIAVQDKGRNFACALTFGTKLQQLFGKRLAIAIYACNFVGNQDGHELAIQIRNSAAARALYAGMGDVELHATKAARSTVECSQALVIYKSDRIEQYGGKLIPVFDI
ncbi:MULTISPECIES: hypothetical protein [unclassified Pseudomonas]|uniref:hypothetical protein n=1 Tax=unclassified Pseudomonas TaxID=196821 RepID=UPI000CD2F979|nr:MULTISPECIES: hypothetical protein [unclassified Pseudomonas]POA30998.1 hypothetical protein C1887_14885 [Pseudomonas sp. GW456-R21]POA67893.1 hypothetical protein C1884_10855 [Pseudomonas sp. GW460-R15]